MSQVQGPALGGPREQIAGGVHPIRQNSYGMGVPIPTRTEADVERRVQERIDHLVAAGELIRPADHHGHRPA